jgi:hypothetical protein
LFRVKPLVDAKVPVSIVGSFTAALVNGIVEPLRRSSVAYLNTMIVMEAVMTVDRRPLPDELEALKEIISGKAADTHTMQRLVACNLVEEFEGTALLTNRGIEAAALLSCPD